MGGLPSFANRTVLHRSFSGSPMMHSHGTPLLRAAAALVATAVLAACDAPTDPAQRAAAGGPSLLITPACAGTGGETHGEQVITTAQTWTRANSPHRVTGHISVQGAAGRLTVAPGAVVCFEPATDLVFEGGGRLTARGRDTAQILFTARDRAWGWRGLEFTDTTSGPSYLTHVRVEYAAGTAIHAAGQHPVYVDSAVIRQNWRGVELLSSGSRLSRSVVDTTADRASAAVWLEAGTRFEQTIVRGSAQAGVRAFGDVLLLGGRIEGSRGIGLEAWGLPINRWSRAIRVVGGQSYGAEMGAEALATMYPTPALQDSLLGNAVDSLLVVGGGPLRRSLTVGPRLPLRVWHTVVDSGGALIAEPGASFTFEDLAGIQVQNGGRLASRGTAANPVLFTANDPARGWTGIMLSGAGVSNNYVTNSRLEHVSVNYTAITAYGAHRVIVDSSVIRQSGRAAALYTQNSRMSRTRVDTMLDSRVAAVELGGNVRLESTRILAPAGPGVKITSSTVLVASCEVRDGDQDGIVVNTGGMVVRNCNLVNNLGVGIRNTSGGTADAAGNWWGDTGGPTGPGGDGVSGDVVYTPWRTTPFVLPYVP
jgi:hypothetical protein